MTFETYSILSAASKLERRKQRRSSGLSGSQSSKEKKSYFDLVDVVAIVAGVATLQSPAASMTSSTPRVDLRIVDQSLPGNTVAKVSIYGSQELLRINEEHIAPGDVLRFNSLQLSRRQHHRSPSPTNQKVLHFEQSLDNPDPGCQWYKLGRIRVMEPEEDLTSANEAPLSTVRAILVNDLGNTGDFPREMATSDDRIHELLNWYATKMSSGGNRGEETSSAGAARVLLKTDDSRRLSPLPCKRRSLMEIQTSLGLLSNIQVRVTHCDPVLPPPSQNSSRRTTEKSSPERQGMGFATLTDETGTTMSFVDLGHRFHSAFVTALDQGQVLMISYVQGKRQSDLFGRPLGSDEVVLWPTRRTTVVVLSTNDDSGRSSNNIFFNRTSSQAGDETQPTQHFVAAALSAPFLDTSDGHFLIDSSIEEMVVNGINISERIADWTPASMSKYLLTEDGMHFLQAEIKLNVTDRRLSPSGKVLAPNAVVQSLCGGITPKELVGIRGQPGQDQEAIRPVTWNSFRLLRAIFHERVSLQWTIDARRDPSMAVTVKLPTRF